MKHNVKLILILWLPSAVFCEGNYGYLFLNHSAFWPICEQPSNNICGIQNRTVDFANHMLHNNSQDVANSLNMTLSLLTQVGYSANATCRSAIVDYSCADIPICDDANTTFGMDIERKKRACLNREACSEQVRSNLGLNYWQCENITSFWAAPQPLDHCIDLPDINNTCPKRNYKVLYWLIFLKIKIGILGACFLKRCCFLKR